MADVDHWTESLRWYLQSPGGISFLSRARVGNVGLRRNHEVHAKVRWPPFLDDRPKRITLDVGACQMQDWKK